MTYHIQQKNYNCPKCSAVYIPFNKEVVCPNCGSPTNFEGCFDFIDRLVSSMKSHKIQYGSFTPPAWYNNGSLASHVQSDCFKIFDNLEINKPKDEKLWLSTVMAEKFEFSDDLKYLTKHITDIVLNVYPIYKSQNRFTPSKFRFWLLKKLKTNLP